MRPKGLKATPHPLPKTKQKKVSFYVLASVCILAQVLLLPFARMAHLRVYFLIYFYLFLLGPQREQNRGRAADEYGRVA